MGVRVRFCPIYSVVCVHYTFRWLWHYQTGQPGSHRGGGKHRGFFLFYISFLPHLPPAVLAFIFIARRVRPSLSFVDNDVGVCVYLLTNLSLSTVRFKREKRNLGSCLTLPIRTHDLTVRRCRGHHQLNTRATGSACISKYLGSKAPQQ